LIWTWKGRNLNAMKCKLVPTLFAAAGLVAFTSCTNTQRGAATGAAAGAAIGALAGGPGDRAEGALIGGAIGGAAGAAVGSSRDKRERQYYGPPPPGYRY